MNPVQFYKCLADDTRLRCLLMIQHYGELCVCELTEALDVIQPKISRHLAQLKKCKLLLDRKQGQWVFYRLNPKLDAWAQNVLEITQKNQSGFLFNNSKRLKNMGDRPERKKSCS